ncbi:MAG TPA: ribose-phosphate diphosphokinase, partial [Anaerohalosphaeraceae bacterium]|nr:ribose-phosphate diphosphokinase [Anaerohalosphaeraceae bacterium]
VANLITSAGASRVLSLDMHAKQLQGFFDIPVDHLTAEPVIVQYLKRKKMTDLTVVAPDVGNMKTASRYATALGAELAIIHKRRLTGQEILCEEIIGSVEGRNIVMVDDMIATAGTITGAAKKVRSLGAREIVVGATHGVFAEPALERLKEAPIDEIIVTDTIPLKESVRKLPHLKVLSVASLIGEAMRRIHSNESISTMFKHYGEL